MWILVIYLISCVAAADALPPLPSSSTCASYEKQCDDSEAILEELPDLLEDYMKCLKSRIARDDGCRPMLRHFIKRWNKFVDLCHTCASKDSPLKGCPRYDQNFVCPPKMKTPH